MTQITVRCADTTFVFNPDNIIPIIEEGIKTETLALEANVVLGNHKECMLIKHRIADAKILLLVLTGDLP